MSHISIRSYKLTDEQLAKLLTYEDWEHYDPPIGPGELYALVSELIAFRKLPKHSGGCSNQNVIDLVGAYKGVEKCGCRKA